MVGYQFETRPNLGISVVQHVPGDSYHVTPRWDAAVILSATWDHVIGQQFVRCSIVVSLLDHSGKKSAQPIPNILILLTVRTGARRNW